MTKRLEASSTEGNKWMKRYVRLGGAPTLWQFIKRGCKCRHCELNRKIRRERVKERKSTHAQ